MHDIVSNNQFIVTDAPSMVVLDKSGLKITFKLERPPDIPDLLVINMLAQNSGSTTLTDFLFQAAVPRVRYNAQIHAQSLRFLMH